MRAFFRAPFTLLTDEDETQVPSPLGGCILAS